MFHEPPSSAENATAHTTLPQWEQRAHRREATERTPPEGDERPASLSVAVADRDHNDHHSEESTALRPRPAL